jgi:hypothetical protein
MFGISVWREYLINIKDNKHVVARRVLFPTTLAPALRAHRSAGELSPVELETLAPACDLLGKSCRCCFGLVPSQQHKRSWVLDTPLSAY